MKSPGTAMAAPRAGGTRGNGRPLGIGIPIGGIPKGIMPGAPGMTGIPTGGKTGRPLPGALPGGRAPPGGANARTGGGTAPNGNMPGRAPGKPPGIPKRAAPSPTPAPMPPAPAAAALAAATAAALAALAAATALPLALALPPAPRPLALPTGLPAGRTGMGPRPQAARAAPTPAFGTLRSLASAAAPFAFAAAISRACAQLPADKRVERSELCHHLLLHGQGQVAVRHGCLELAQQEARCADSVQSTFPSQSGEPDGPTGGVCPQAKPAPPNGVREQRIASRENCRLSGCRLHQ